MKLSSMMLLLPIALLTACSENGQHAQSVNFVQQKPGSECQYIDTITTTWFVNPTDDAQLNQQKANDALQKQALQKGGNTLYVVQPNLRTPMLSLRTGRKSAELYKCP